MHLEVGDRRFDITTEAVVVGILNRTPDSFFDQGTYFGFDEFLRKADGLVADGADVLDVGGVKAGPGPDVDEQEELDRVIPAIEALRARFDVPLCVDTWRASVARAAFAAGAVVGNDISGFADPDYLAVCADAGASVVATHIRLRPARARSRTSLRRCRHERVRLPARSRATRGAGGDPARAHHARRRPRSGQERAGLARVAARLRSLGRVGLPGVPVGLEQAILGPPAGHRRHRSI